MQKAADPKHVRNAFQALGVPLDDRPAESSIPGATDHAEEVVDLRWTATCDDLVPRLLADTTQPQLMELSQAWFAVRNPQQPASLESVQEIRQHSFALLLELSQSISDGSSETADAPIAPSSWAGQLERFRSEWQDCWQWLQGQQPASELGVSPELERAMTVYLDDRLVHSMRDASPWGKPELVAFWRLLQRGQGRGRANVRDFQTSQSPRISTLQLESESRVYKGSSIRFRGELRRVELVEPSDALIEIDHYWLMWLRGEDGASKPIAVYSSDPNCATLATRLDMEQGIYPSVEITGIPAKRLAYASESGVQVAPTLFALSVNQLESDSPASVSSPPLQLAKDLGLALLAGALIAGAILASVVAHWRGSPRPGRAAYRKSIPSNKTVLLLLASLGMRGAFAQEETPPWASMDPKQQVWQAMFQERIETAWLPGESETLFAYLRGETEFLPDGPLKLLRLFEQLSWGQGITSIAAVNVPAQHLRIQPIAISGIVHSAMPVPLSQDQEAWFQRQEGDRLFRLEVQMRANLREETGLQSSAVDAQPDAPLISVFCCKLPMAWMAGAQLRQPVQIHGFVLTPHTSDIPLCVFCPRVNWMISDAGNFAFAPKIAPHLLALGRLGWDLAWVDQVGAHSQKPLQQDESEAFYTLLKTLGDTPRVLESSYASLKPQAAMSVLAAPVNAVGQYVSWRVRLVAGSVVPIQSPQAQQQLGADHYFQFDGLVDIGDQRIRYQVASESGAQEVNFAREFPVTIVMKAASEFVPQSGLAAGELTWHVGQYVQVEGCFYRLWSYQSELMQSKSESARQAAPLVVATTIKPALPPIATTSNEIGWFGYALCAATLAIMSAILVLAAKKDPPRRRKLP